MNLKHFLQLVDNHSINEGNAVYSALALSGEVGEVANLIKKAEMIRLHPEWLSEENSIAYHDEKSLKARIDDELGDAFFYLVRCIMDNGSTIEEVMKLQIDKIAAQSKQYGRTFLK